MEPATPPGPPRAGESDVALAKHRLRARIRAERVAHPETAEAARRRVDLALRASRGQACVACYGSAPGEPDTWSLIRHLAAEGVRVLLPVLGRRPDGSIRRDPDWAWYTGTDDLRPGFRGILEPTGEPLGEDALRSATFVWCSALAATPQGDRLGTGGGWYDRALTHVAPGTPVGALLRESELLAELPTEPWDRRVDLLVTERRVLRCAE